MKQYRYRAYKVSWGGTERDWNRFRRWIMNNTTRPSGLGITSSGVGVIAFTTTPQELKNASETLNIDTDSLVIKVGTHYEPLEDVLEEDHT